MHKFCTLKWPKIIDNEYVNDVSKLLKPNILTIQKNYPPGITLCKLHQNYWHQMQTLLSSNYAKGK